MLLVAVSMGFGPWRRVHLPSGTVASMSYLLSREGLTQDDPLSIIIYGLALVPLAKQIREATTDAIQSWYSDDMVMTGTANGN